MQWKTWYSKNNIDTTKNIDLENNVTYLWSKCSQIDYSRCRILQSHSRSRKHHDLPFDDSSLSLGIEMMEISRLEARVFSLDCRKRVAKFRNPTLKGVFINFLLGLSDFWANHEPRLLNLAQKVANWLINQ